MADKAHKDTDAIIDQLDKKLGLVYSQANEEMQQKLDSYLQKFEAKDKIKLQDLKAGKITKKEYNQWKIGQVEIGKRWAELKETLATDMTNTNKIAASLINGHKPSVYALNHNYATFQLEKDSLVDTSYTLYSHEAVENLIKNEPNLLPKNKINVPKDKAWNKKKIDNAITQGILQGESLKDVSGRLKDVTDMNQNAAMRNARTAMTGAQNSGRIDAYERAKMLGMDVKKVWLATLDGRTRHSHALLDGETIDIGELFSNGLMFPGDADGAPSEVYNCRCTLLGQPKGIDYNVSDLTRRNDKLGGMSYEAWKNFHSFGLSDGAMPDINITNAWLGKKYGYVYNLMKNSELAGHGADANNFYYTLKGLGEETGIGKPPQVWAKYLAGELDDNQVKKIEDILKKYLPDSTVKKIDNVADALSHDDFLKSIKDMSIWSDQMPSEAFEYMHKKVGHGSISNFWDDYKAGKIKDGHLDELLGFKKVVKTTDKIDNPFAGKLWHEMINESELLKPGQPAMTYLLDEYDVGWGKHLEDWANGKIKDSKLDDLLLGKADNISDAAKQAKAALKIPKGNPMTKEQADNYKVNVFYDKSEATLSNCQTNAFAYECRRQGYDVVALPKDKSLKEIFDLQDDLSTNQSKAWINKSTGEPPKHELEWWSEGKKNPTNAKMLQAIDDAVGNDGERYAISLVNSSGKSAHILNIDRDENGLLRIIDNQRGPLEKNIWIGDEVENYLQNFKTINYLVRQDDCVPNPEYFNKILVSAAKAKPDLPASASAFSDYSKLNKFVKDNNLGKTSEYYKKWKYGLIDNDDLDDLLKGVKISDNVPKVSPASKTLSNVSKAQNGLDMDLIKDKSASKVWKELNEAKAGGGKFWSDITAIGKQQGIKPADVWKKYLAGELNTDDVAKIESHLAKLYKKADDIVDDMKKTLPKGFADMDDKMAVDVIEMITPKAPGIKGPSQYYKKWLNNEIVDIDLDDYFKVPTITPKVTTTKSINVLDAVKNKKVSAIWNELKAEGGNTYSQWWKTVGDIGKSYDKKQSAVWDMYLKGQLKDDEKEKIENFLLKNYLKKVDDIIDYSKFGGKEVYDTLKKYDSVDDFLFGAPAAEYDKIAKIFHDNDDELQAAIDKIKKLEKTKTATQVAEKSEDLIKAEKKLDKAEDALKKAKEELKKNVDNSEVWQSIWKDDVTLDDYAKKKATIPAKKIYYEDELNKLKNDPSYQSWLSAEDKQDKIWKFEKLLDDLEDYEKQGQAAEKYYDAITKAQEAVDKAKQEVVKNTPVNEAFSQAKKDAAVWGKNKTDDYKRVDKIFDPHAREVHGTRTAKETSAYMDYTSASGPYNKPLVGFDSPDGTGSSGWTEKYWMGPGKVDIDKRGRGDKIRALTTLVEKSTYDFDFWMQSSQDFATLEGKEGFLGIPYGTLRNMKDSEFQKFIGTTAELPQFISGAVNKGGGSYNPGNMRLNIYVPKGSEALYVLEDGTFSKHEHEMILQRGGTYRITNMYWGYDDINKEHCLFVDMELHPEMGYDKFQQTKSK